MCGDEQDARDVLQETLVALVRSVREIRGTSRLSTWLYSVARSFCIKQRRKAKTVRSTDEQAPTPSRPASGRPNEEDLPDAARGPEETAVVREQEALLRRALQGLSAEHREVLILRDGEGLTAPEVAEVLLTSTEAVKSRLHRARVSLRDAVAAVSNRQIPAPTPDRCPDVLASYSRYLENEISAEFCRTMEDHLSGCRHCTLSCASLKEALAACGAPAREAVPVSVQAAVRGAVKDALRQLTPSPPT